jgi:hypothetical protein
MKETSHWNYIVKNVKECRKCNKQFIPQRSTKIFCSATCRNSEYQQKDRKINAKNSRESPTKRRENQELYDLSNRLAETFYNMAPGRRLGYLSYIIRDARSASGKLRQVLTNKTLVHPDRDCRYLFYRRQPSQFITVSQACDRYCKSFWGYGVKAVVLGFAPEPPTGEA